MASPPPQQSVQRCEARRAFRPTAGWGLYVPQSTPDQLTKARPPPPAQAHSLEQHELGSPPASSREILQKKSHQQKEMLHWFLDAIQPALCVGPRPGTQGPAATNRSGTLGSGVG